MRFHWSGLKCSKCNCLEYEALIEVYAECDMQHEKICQYVATEDGVDYGCITTQKMMKVISMYGGFTEKIFQLVDEFKNDRNNAN